MINRHIIDKLLVGTKYKAKPQMTVKIKQEAALHGRSNHKRRYLEYNIKLKTNNSMLLTPRTQYQNYQSIKVPPKLSVVHEKYKYTVFTCEYLYMCIRHLHISIAIKSIMNLQVMNNAKQGIILQD